MRDQRQRRDHARPFTSPDAGRVATLAAPSDSRRSCAARRPQGRLTSRHARSTTHTTVGCRAHSSRGTRRVRDRGSRDGARASRRPWRLARSRGRAIAADRSPRSPRSALGDSTATRSHPVVAGEHRRRPSCRFAQHSSDARVGTRLRVSRPVGPARLVLVQGGRLAGRRSATCFPRVAGDALGSGR